MLLTIIVVLFDSSVGHRENKGLANDLENYLNEVLLAEGVVNDHS